MDVTCNRCGTSYEFEEGLVSATGTTVKCTQCGHLFKVYRTTPPPATTTPRGAEPDASSDEPLKWRVRRTDGSIHSLESLSELTRLIRAGQFHRDDEISRTGQLWRKLGQISELASLFEPLPRVRRLSDPPPAPTLVKPAPTLVNEPDVDAGDLVDTQSASVISDATTTQRMQPQPSTRSRFEVMGSDVELAAPGARKQEAEVATGEARPQAARPPATLPRPPKVDPAATLAAPTQAPAPDTTESQLDRRRRGLAWPVAIGVPLLIAAGVAGALFLRSSRAPQPRVQPAREFLRNGDQALASHRFARFDEAISEYSKALAYAKDDPHILSSISRVYAVWAEALRTRFSLSEDEDGPSESENLRSEEHRLTAQAKFYGERAAQRNPGNEEASVALSDALRLSGNLVGARAELDRARSTEGVPEAETLRVAALLARDEAHGDLTTARKLAARAVAQEPTMIRARLLLAQCMIAARDLDGARMHLDAVRAQDASNPALHEADAQLDRARHAKPSRPPRQKPVARPPAAPSATSGGAKEPDTARGPKIDPMELVRHGEAALERGAVHTAEHDFEQALSLSPHLARAETGLGYVALERSEPSAAISHFKPAASAGHAEALIGLGDAYRRLGRARAALEAYQKYLKQFPGGSRTSIAQRQIELLQEQVQQAGP